MRTTLRILLNLFALMLFAPTLSFASTTIGVIDSTNRYAYTENMGWLDFGGNLGNVTITDSSLSGYVFGENIGWVSLNCSNDNSCDTANYKVSNDGDGNLSGYAWGENAGWINFNPANGGVTINASGEFVGYAYGENTGWIVFNCSTTNSCATVDYKVSTDYRPQSARPVIASPGNGSPGGYRTQPFSGAIVPSSPTTPTIENQSASVITTVSKAVSAFIPSFLKPARFQPPVSEPSIEKAVTTTTPAIFTNTLTLISASQAGLFVLAPLPPQISALAKKFPELGASFKKLGIAKVSDLGKLKGNKFILPGLGEKIGGNAPGPRLSSLSIGQKVRFPAEIVFAKSGDLIDYNIQLSIDDDGNPAQTINTLAGKPLDLIVKADKPAKSVKGYLTVKNIKRELGRNPVPVTSLMAMPIMATLGKSLSADDSVKVEEKMVIAKFDYEDIDRDGIYTATIQTPLVHGEYEVISIIEYDNPKYGKKELRLTAVVDPEGYIYEKTSNKETRIPEAKVSLLWKSPARGSFELWPAKEYSQVNPQKTDKTGNYSFLVTEGVYKLIVSAPGYVDYIGDEFEVTNGRGVHDNIALKPKGWWRRFMDSVF